jgi:hypothetical protein
MAFPPHTCGGRQSRKHRPPLIGDSFGLLFDLFALRIHPAFFSLKHRIGLHAFAVAGIGDTTDAGFFLIHEVSPAAHR